MKKAFLSSVIFTFVLFSCQEDTTDQSTDPTASESQEIVENTVSSAANDIITLVESEGVTALTGLAASLEQYVLAGGRSSEKEWTKKQLNTVKEYLIEGPVKRVGAVSPTTLEDIKGLYVWNFETEEFDLSESELFVVQFPAEGSSANNAEFRISQLAYEIITEGQSSLSAPSAISCNLKIDGTTLVDLSYDVKWSIAGPKEADVSLFVSPFTFEVNFTDTFEKSTSLLTSISLEKEVISSVDVDVSYETSSKDDPYFIEGHAQYRDLKIAGNTDLRKIGLSGDPNTFVDLELQSNDTRIGDIIFILEDVGENQKDYIPYVQYADGSQQDLETILTPVLQEIEQIFAEF